MTTIPNDQFNDTPDPSRPHLINLPPEIQITIYRLALGTHSVALLGSASHLVRTNHLCGSYNPSLFRVCKSILSLVWEAQRGTFNHTLIVESRQAIPATQAIDRGWLDHQYRDILDQVRLVSLVDGNLVTRGLMYTLRRLPSLTAVEVNIKCTHADLVNSCVEIPGSARRKFRKGTPRAEEVQDGVDDGMFKTVWSQKLVRKGLVALDGAWLCHVRLFLTGRCIWDARDVVGNQAQMLVLIYATTLRQMHVVYRCFGPAHEYHRPSVEEYMQKINWEEVEVEEG